MKNYISDGKNIVNVLGIRWITKYNYPANCQFSLNIAYKNQEIILIYGLEQDRDNMFNAIQNFLGEEGKLLDVR